MHRCILILSLFFISSCSSIDWDYYKEKPQYQGIEEDKTKYKVRLRWKHIYIENGLKTRKYGLNLRDNKIYFVWVIPFNYLK